MAHRSLFLVALGLAACAVGCGDDETAPSEPAGTGATGGTAAIPDPPKAPISAKATVKMKSVHRLSGDLEQVLGLSSAELCHELGADACTEVHAIALGGTDAYDSGVYEPLGASISTSPIAIDRIVLSACRARADADLGDPAAAVIFAGIAVDGAGAVDPTSAPAQAAIDTLYRRSLLRDPTAEEREHVTGLYATLVDAGATVEPARDWATLSCFSVLTTMEFLFY